jgi:hypothetical protein
LQPVFNSNIENSNEISNVDLCIANLESIIDKLKRMQFHDLLNDTTMNDFFKNNFSLITQICLFLNSQRFENTLCGNEIDKSVVAHMYPAFYSQYQPRVTTGDGNCLWHMISLTLCGSEALTNCLRWLTVISLLFFKSNFIEILEKRYKNSCEPQFPQNQAIVKFQTILRTAIDDYLYGNEYHLQALSTVLARDIFIYSYFTRNNELILKKNLSSTQLVNLFKNKSMDIGHHIRYQPIKNDFFKTDSLNLSLNGYFNGSLKHYTALIPKTRRVDVFVPNTNIFLQHDES